MPSGVPNNNMMKQSEVGQRLGIRTPISTYQVLGYFGQVGDTENGRMAHPIAIKLCCDVLRCNINEFIKFELAKRSSFQVSPEIVVFFLLPLCFFCSSI